MPNSITLTIFGRSVENGYLQIYTGDGKGKTTAAIGLAVRAAGAGLKVLFLQFIKCGDYSELTSLKKLSDKITVRQFGKGFILKRKPTYDEISLAQEGLQTALDAMTTDSHDVIVLDEVFGAINAELFSEEQLLAILDKRPDNVEMILTGRKAGPAFIQKADLLTEMCERKHYFKNGVKARTGIEK